MSDAALTWDLSAGAADLSVVANDLAHEDGLRTAVMLSLFLDRIAESSDQLPSGSGRRGWWADGFSEVAGDRIGSRLWLLGRAKRTDDLLRLVEEYAKEALDWLVEDGVASSVAVTASFPRKGMVGMEVTIARPNGAPGRYRFAATWEAA
jgi:phage gp46-like protein